MAICQLQNKSIISEKQKERCCFW